MKDYYKSLGVERDATPEEIKKAFRKLALECHPDRNPGKECEERFKEINEAYSCLIDPQKRANYDRFGTSEGIGAGAGFGGFGAGAFGDIFEDIFGDFFGTFTGRRGPRPARGRDLRYDLDITLEESAFGTEKVIDVLRWEDCASCGATGSRSRNPGICPECNGTGQMRMQQGFFTVSRTCPRCRGEGKHIKDPCSTCHGQGKVRVPRKVSVKIPPGVDAGSRLKMTREGEPGQYGGPAGDLYIIMDVKEHPFFRRDGMNIYCEVPLSFPQAVFGTEVEVPTLDGSHHALKVPPGTQPGTAFQIKGKGVHRLGSRARGDQIVTVNVAVPKNISQRQKEILEEFAALSGEEHQRSFKEKLKDIFTGTP
jgi:molecular chaperone DnaJ